MKVHKRQCKYFSGVKNPKDTMAHNKETCIYCIMQASAGDDTFREDNPNYICVYSDSVNSKAKPLMSLQRNYPLPLARAHDDRLERIVDVLQRILLKLNMANDIPVSRFFPEEVGELESQLWTMKEEMFVAKVTNPPKLGVSHIPEAGGIMEAADALNAYLQCDALQIVQTFLVLLELFFNVAAIQAEELIKNPEKVLPKDQRMISAAVRKSSFLKKTDLILDALDHQVLPHSALAALVCNGETEKLCSSCGDDITIQTIWHPGYKLPQAEATVVLCPHKDNIFCCGADECEETLANREPFQVWTMAVETSIIKMTETRCDSCFLFAPLQEVHRSICRTKNYCSKVI